MSAASTGSAGRHFWERTVLGWHLAFGAMVAVAAIAAVTNPDISGARRWAALILCMLWVLWYAGVGAPTLTTDRSSWWARAYVVGALCFTLGLLGLVPEISWAAFVLVPQIFALLHRMLEAIAAVAILLIGFGAVLFWQDDGAGTQPWALIFSLLASFAFAVVIGVWISGIIVQSRQRAGLIEELESARAELALLSHDTGVAAERERLSREIHDTLAQGFTSIVMLLEAAEATLDRDPVKAREQLSLARTAARENLAESRSLIAALSPPTLREQGLVGALTRLTERLDAEMGGVSTRLIVEGVERPLSPATEVVLLRAAQEALSNVRKHSSAQAVAVTLDFDVADTTLTVRDNGCGFATDTTDGGFGLHGMRSRVADIDGSVSVSSAPGTGTTVRVSVP
ncbi:MAG: sensor histidine kinase [Geodermatophilaceae bacterium]